MIVLEVIAAVKEEEKKQLKETTNGAGLKGRGRKRSWRRDDGRRLGGQLGEGMPREREKIGGKDRSF